MLGLPKGTILLIPYTQEWKVLYEQEKAVLESVIGEFVEDIEWKKLKALLLVFRNHHSSYFHYKGEKLESLYLTSSLSSNVEILAQKMCIIWPCFPKISWLFKRSIESYKRFFWERKLWDTLYSLKTISYFHLFIKTLISGKSAKLVIDMRVFMKRWK